MTVITLSGCYGTGTSTTAEYIAEYYESEYNETTNIVDIRDYIKSRYEIVNKTDIANWETYREWGQTVRSKYDETTVCLLHELQKRGTSTTPIWLCVELTPQNKYRI